MNRLVRQLFEELATLTPAEREEVFAERPVAAGVGDEVESLLSFDSAQGENLSACVADAAAETVPIGKIELNENMEFGFAERWLALMIPLVSVTVGIDSVPKLRCKCKR
jgi:hypothetical protein